MSKEICQMCEKIYEGGPNTFLCPVCRKKMQKRGGENSAKRRAEKKAKKDMEAQDG